jgi:cyanate permease
VGMALGPVTFGAVFDATGSYHAILALGAPICLAALALALMLRPYPHAAAPRPKRA